MGIYAIIRLFSLVFYHEPGVTHLFIGILAAITMVLGAMGAVAYGDIKRIMTYNVVVGIGFILAGAASFSLAGMRGSVYYLIHDMIVKALLFLLGNDHSPDGHGQAEENERPDPPASPIGLDVLYCRPVLVRHPAAERFIGKLFVTQGTFQAAITGWAVSVF